MLKELTMWYASWFDTPYYHILYKNRGNEEAQEFMDTLTNYLNLNSGEKILDLGCSRGRHSIYLNQLGYNVTGVDLSKNSIKHASQFTNKSLKFEIHDMRKPFPDKFSAVFNLFTSFGYFDNEQDDLNTIEVIKSSLLKDGLGVIDFMNVNYVIENLIPEETKKIDGITFDIKKYVRDGYIYKEISFIDQGEKFLFTEKVKALTLENFKVYFEKLGIDLLDVFGNYQLQKFNKTDSPRLILIFK